jgi:hypothetical protein
MVKADAKSTSPTDSRSYLRQDRGISPMTADLSSDTPVFWGRGITEPDRAHVRETRAGQPVIDRLDDGPVFGYAI